MLFYCSAKLDRTFCPLLCGRQHHILDKSTHFGTRLLNFNPSSYYLYDLAQVSEPFCAPVFHLGKWYHHSGQTRTLRFTLDFSPPSPSHTQSPSHANFTTLMLRPMFGENDMAFWVPNYIYFVLFYSIPSHLIPIPISSVWEISTQSCQLTQAPCSVIKA